MLGARHRDGRDALEDRAQRAPVLGHAAVYEGPSGSELVTNAPKFIRGYDTETGPELERLATNRMRELLMATPALSQGVLYVRAVSHLFAIGRKSAARLR